MKPETLTRCCDEAMKFVNMASAVHTHEVEMEHRMSQTYIDAGKESGLVGAQSIILTRALADLRQGR
jgi:hypothetical protein